MKRIALTALLIGMTAAPALAGELESFVAAFGDNYQGYSYKNTMNYDKFVAALEDGYTGYAYKNTMDSAKFIAALEDGYTGYA